MRLKESWLRTLNIVVLYSAILFPLFWIVIGGILRTPIYIMGGLLGIYLLRKNGLHRRLGKYGVWAIAGILLVIMACFRIGSESQEWPPIWFFLMMFYAVPAGMLVAHCDEESKPILNWIFAVLMLLFGAWGYLVMQHVDMEHVVKLSPDFATRGDQQYPVELFGIFSWENVKMQLIPWCAYPLAAVIAIAYRGPLAARCILFGGSALGCYVAGAFLTRTVFLAAAFAIAIGAAVCMVKAERKRQLAMVMTILLLAATLYGVIRYVPVVNDYVMGLLDRFSYTADDGRQDLWASSSKLMFRYPLGGGDAYLEDHFWAHDLPLDMGLLYGLPGFFCMTSFLLALIYWVARWARNFPRDIEVYEMILLSVFISALISCLISPPDLAFLTPLVMVGAFAKERMMMRFSRAEAHRRIIERAGMLATMPPNGVHV